VTKTKLQSLCVSQLLIKIIFISMVNDMSEKVD